MFAQHCCVLFISKEFEWLKRFMYFSSNNLTIF
nr:MAG TPA: FAM193 family C-terminal [Bacteriophage sp.]